MNFSMNYNTSEIKSKNTVKKSTEFCMKLEFIKLNLESFLEKVKALFTKEH